MKNHGIMKITVPKNEPVENSKNRLSIVAAIKVIADIHTPVSIHQRKMVCVRIDTRAKIIGVPNVPKIKLWISEIPDFLASGVGLSGGGEAVKGVSITRCPYIIPS